MNANIVLGLVLRLLVGSFADTQSGIHVLLKTVSCRLISYLFSRIPSCFVKGLMYV